MKKLYKVGWIRQDVGTFTESYVFAENISLVEDEFHEIVSISPCEFTELPETE